MPSIYDQLQDQLGDDQPSGMTPSDILDLPDDQRQIMTFMLRNRTASLEGVTLNDLQEKFPKMDDLPAVIDALVRASWLIELGEPPAVHYKINLRKKRSTGSLSSDLWSSVSGRMTEDE